MIKVKASDLIRRLAVFDGTEPEFLQLEFAVPASRGITFRAEDFLDHCFTGLRKLLGEEIFDRIVDEQGFQVPEHGFQSHVGTDELSLYYAIHYHNGSDVVSIVLVAFGEFQPARYKIHVEGIWDVVGLPPPLAPK